MKIIFLFIAITCSLIFFDQISKDYSRSVEFESFILNLKPHFNYGFIGGMFKSATGSIKDTILFTYAFAIIFILFISILLLGLSERKSIMFSFAFFLSGIMGNLIDRFRYQFVVDFLEIPFFFLQGIYFNFADVFLFIGCLALLCNAWLIRFEFFPKDNNRSKFVSNLKFQFKIGLLLSAFSFFSSMMLFIFSYQFLKIHHDSSFLKTYLATATVLGIAIVLFTFFLGFILSHRISGPIYAIKRHIRSTRNGDVVKFQLRQSDEFKDIEKDLNYLNEDYSALLKFTEEKNKK